MDPSDRVNAASPTADDASNTRYSSSQGDPDATDYPPPSRPLRLPPQGTVRYQFLEFIDEGGMGEVWRGLDTRLNSEVALKVVHRGMATTECVARFREECRLVRQLKHPGIVPVFDLDELSDGRPFFVMELVEGRTLAKWLWERPDPKHDLARWLQVFAEVCQVIAFAHDRKILHQDLKPSNLMLGESGSVRVMDWGIAKYLTERAESDEPGSEAASALVSMVGIEGSSTVNKAPSTLPQVQGTPAYMAPEQARGLSRQINTRSDVFGLGAILCVVLTGRPPYEGKDSLAILRKAEKPDLDEAYARLDRCVAEPELIALAKQCLTADPAGRPQNAGEAAQALESCLQIRQIRSALPPAGPLTRAVQANPILFALVLVLLPHAVGAGLDMAYNLIWAAHAFPWKEHLDKVAWFLSIYTGIALVTTGIITYLLLRSTMGVVNRLRTGGPVTENEVKEARRRSLRLYVLAFALSGAGWLPGGILVPWILGGMIGEFPDWPTLLHFLMSFTIAGLIAMTYCTLAAEFLILRVAYPCLWIVPQKPADEAHQELRGVPARLRRMPLLAAMVPLASALPILLNQYREDSVLQHLVICLIVLGMAGCGLASMIAHYLLGIVSGFTTFRGAKELQD